VILFDDIHWSTGLWENWNSLGLALSRTHAIGAGRFGVCVWDEGGVRLRSDTLYGTAVLFGSKSVPDAPSQPNPGSLPEACRLKGVFAT
jgi:hypothetical protein